MSISNRFDYVKYDEDTITYQAAFKNICIELELAINCLIDGRSKSLALTALEEVYMWIGKGLRDGQLKRNKDTELQEGRGNE